MSKHVAEPDVSPCNIGVVTLSHILLSTLLLRILVHIFNLLLSSHADSAIIFFNSVAEVNRGVLKGAFNRKTFYSSLVLVSSILIKYHVLKDVNIYF